MLIAKKNNTVQGKIVLLSEFTPKPLRKRIQKAIAGVKQRWYIIQGTFVQNSWDDNFAWISMVFCQELWLYKNFHSSIIKIISPVTYQNLIKLDVRANQIFNIEPLSFVSMQLVQQINLQFNYISNVKTLQKSKFTHLRKIFLSFNPSIAFSDLNRMKRNPVKEVDRLFDSRLHVLKQDFSFVAKFQLTQLNQSLPYRIIYNGFDCTISEKPVRIKQDKLQACITRNLTTEEE